MPNLNKFFLISITPIFILLAHYLAVFPHEYAHSFMAWALGYKINPLALNYGGTSWGNLLLLGNIDENVNYHFIYASGHHAYVALIAFAGPGIANGSMFVLTLFLMKNKKIKRKPYLYYFIFWFNLMNLGNFYDYVPIRTFASHGDMAGIEWGLNISPWSLYVIFGYLVIFLMIRFFTSTLISVYVHLGLKETIYKAGVMIISVLILFGFFGGIIGVILSDGVSSYGDISRFLTLTSVAIIPAITLIMWPTRLWVQQKTSLFYSLTTE